MGTDLCPEVRIIQLNNPRDNDQFNYKGNSIQTTKYTWWTFLPRGLYEQFRRVANVYFLAVAILSCTPVSPVNPITNVAPLVLVISLSFAKEAFEDSKRRKKDREVNGSMVDVVRNKTLVSVPWSDVVVGDIVKVYDRGYIPADIVVLNTTNPNGVCYVETMNLDGETNLKHKQACDATLNCKSDAAMGGQKCSIECEQPNESLYTFTGNLYSARSVYPLTPNQVLLRGCVLRNTQHVYGAVVFTGHETKVMMNSTSVPSKRSKLERRLDYLIMAIFVLLAVICVFGSIGSAMWVTEAHWYLNLGNPNQSNAERAMFDPSNRPLVAALTFMTMVTLYSSIIPISLYVSIEIIKYIQATGFINQDIDMYDEESDTPALARTSNLNEELGQIEHILSDKTGTLTCNRMEFFKCSIAGVCYGEGVTEIQRLLGKAGTPAPEDSDESAKGRPVVEGCNFYDRRVFDGNYIHEADPDAIREFFNLLAVCHTVLPEERQENGNTIIQYQAASPDEAALVGTAKAFGFCFYRRGLTSITVKETFDEQAPMDQEYRVLAVLEFNSFRKRQSIIVELPNGQIRLYCKGADNVIFERLSPEGSRHMARTKIHLEEFGKDGLRTLCVCYRDIPRKDYDVWAQKFYNARTSQTDRDAKIDAVAEEIEAGMILLGCTAIEDKLQPGVPESIAKFMQAGIKLWVLTGDKVETAVNIGYACNLLHDNMQVFMVTSDGQGEDIVLDESSLLRLATENLEAAIQYSKECQSSDIETKMAVVIDGKVLEAILSSKSHQKLLLEAGQLCQSVICCRVSPLQKALVTKLVKDSAGKVTLAIGDGANDVGMIQSADIGIGISGQEGRQAVMASDFAIAQFSFLVKLLFVHGQWSYRRLSRVIVYFFYKNITYTFTQFWFNIYAAYSGQRLYDDWYQSLYNIFFTSIPVLVMGLVDQDVSAKNCLRIPQLYKSGQRDDLFNYKTFLRWLLSSVWQSLVCFYVPVWALGLQAVDPSGHTVGQWAVGTVACCVVIMTVNLRLLLESSYHTWVTYGAVIGSVVLWFGYVAIYCSIWPGSMGDGMDNMHNIYYVIHKIAILPGFWLSLLLAPVAALFPDAALTVLLRYLNPSDHDIIQEYEMQARKKVIDGILEHGEALLPAGPSASSSHSAEAFAEMQTVKSVPRRSSARHSGYAFEDPCHEGYHAKMARMSLQPRESATAAVLKAHSESFSKGDTSIVGTTLGLEKAPSNKKKLKVRRKVLMPLWTSDE